MVTKEMEKTIVPAGPEERRITITFNDVKKYLCPKASDAEIGLFLKVCQAENLNPFARECFLVKYADDQPAAIIVATEVFLKAAEACPEYDGVEAGIVMKDHPAGKLEFRDGALLLDEEESRLVGGWAKVYRKDRQRPIYAAVNIKECIKYTRLGKPTRFWNEMPATMVRKVALSRALREAFPNRFGNTLTTAEFEEISEGGLLPPVLEKGGKPDWRKFWARVKSELGLTSEDARHLLQVDSIKEELVDAGWTMEKIWDELIQQLREQNEPNETITEREPKSVQSLNDLMKACFEDFGMQPRDVIKELGYKSQMDITEKPQEAYLKIKVVKRGR